MFMPRVCSAIAITQISMLIFIIGFYSFSASYHRRDVRLVLSSRWPFSLYFSPLLWNAKSFDLQSVGLLARPNQSGHCYFISTQMQKWKDKNTNDPLLNGDKMRIYTRISVFCFVGIRCRCGRRYMRNFDADSFFFFCIRCARRRNVIFAQFFLLLLLNKRPLQWI